MRILKYIFLLLILSFVALSIFIATQKGDFEVERSKIINSPKTVVFNYVNDLHNWNNFGSWATNDPDIIANYPENTIGLGAYYSWESKDGDGKIETTFVKENDSIAQKMDMDGSPSNVFWRFKDTVGGTKVTWKIKGEMNFTMKIYTALNGGVDRVIGSIYEKSLQNLDKKLDYEINTFKVKIDGLVQKPMTYYLGQTFTTEISKIDKNFKVVVPKIKKFCEQNDIQTVGKPFIIYHTYDVQTQLARVSICVPIVREIFISSGSDILSSKLEPFEGVKATLLGDNSHNKVAIDKVKAFFDKNKYVHNPAISHIEIYTSNKATDKDPSGWVTEFYVPMPPKVVVPEKTYVAPAPVTTAPLSVYNEPTTSATTATSSSTTTVKTPAAKKPAPKTVTPKKATETEVAPVVPKKETAPKPVSEDDEFEF